MKEETGSIKEIASTKHHIYANINDSGQYKWQSPE
jgi:hypothetical protein